MMPPGLPSLSSIEAAASQLASKVLYSPVIPWQGQVKNQLAGENTEVWLKLELLQPGGSFKIRGALLHIALLGEEEKQRGITAVSAGNHAIAVAMAAQVAGTHAKVVMPSTANPARINKCRELGAEVVLVANVSIAFEEVERIKKEEGRTFIHPFEGETTAIATGTIGLELQEQISGLDAVVIPIGGGGLAAGIGAALRQLRPEIELFGVEPTGADTMFRSFQEGSPQRIDRVRSIADSLGAPFAMPYSYGLCRATLDEVVLLEDQAMRAMMAVMFDEFKLAAEPAGAAALAALTGPLRERLAGKKVACIVCGSNIDPATFFSLISEP